MSKVEITNTNLLILKKKLIQQSILIEQLNETKNLNKQLETDVNLLTKENEQLKNQIYELRSNIDNNNCTLHSSAHFQENRAHLLRDVHDLNEQIKQNEQILNHNLHLEKENKLLKEECLRIREDKFSIERELLDLKEWKRKFGSKLSETMHMFFPELLGQKENKRINSIVTNSTNSTNSTKPIISSKFTNLPKSINSPKSLVDPNNLLLTTHSTLELDSQTKEKPFSNETSISNSINDINKSSNRSIFNISDNKIENSTNVQNNDSFPDLASIFGQPRIGSRVQKRNSKPSNAKHSISTLNISNNPKSSHSLNSKKNKEIIELPNKSAKSKKINNLSNSSKKISSQQNELQLTDEELAQFEDEIAADIEEIEVNDTNANINTIEATSNIIHSEIEVKNGKRKRENDILLHRKKLSLLRFEFPSHFSLDKEIDFVRGNYLIKDYIPYILNQFFGKYSSFQNIRNYSYSLDVKAVAMVFLFFSDQEFKTIVYYLFNYATKYMECNSSVVFSICDIFSLMKYQDDRNQFKIIIQNCFEYILNKIYSTEEFNQEIKYNLSFLSLLCGQEILYFDMIPHLLILISDIFFNKNEKFTLQIVPYMYHSNTFLKHNRGPLLQAIREILISLSKKYPDISNKLLIQPIIEELITNHPTENLEFNYLEKITHLLPKLSFYAQDLNHNNSISNSNQTPNSIPTTSILIENSQSESNLELDIHENSNSENIQVNQQTNNLNSFSLHQQENEIKINNNENISVSNSLKITDQRNNAWEIIKSIQLYCTQLSWDVIYDNIFDQIWGLLKGMTKENDILLYVLSCIHGIMNHCLQANKLNQEDCMALQALHERLEMIQSIHDIPTRDENLSKHIAVQTLAILQVGITKLDRHYNDSETG